MNQCTFSVKIYTSSIHTRGKFALDGSKLTANQCTFSVIFLHPQAGSSGLQQTRASSKGLERARADSSGFQRAPVPEANVGNKYCQSKNVTGLAGQVGQACKKFQRPSKETNFAGQGGQVTAKFEKPM